MKNKVKTKMEIISGLTEAINTAVDELTTDILHSGDLVIDFQCNVPDQKFRLKIDKLGNSRYKISLFTEKQMELELTKAENPMTEVGKYVSLNTTTNLEASFKINYGDELTIKKTGMN